MDNVLPVNMSQTEGSAPDQMPQNTLELFRVTVLA